MLKTVILIIYCHIIMCSFHRKIKLKDQTKKCKMCKQIKNLISNLIN